MKTSLTQDSSYKYHLVLILPLPHGETQVHFLFVKITSIYIASFNSKSLKKTIKPLNKFKSIVQRIVAEFVFYSQLAALISLYANGSVPVQIIFKGLIFVLSLSCWQMIWMQVMMALTGGYKLWPIIKIDILKCEHRRD